MLAQRLQSQIEYLLIDLQAQPLANHRETGMIRSFLIQLVVEKGADRHRIGAARCNGAFARQVFEKSNHDHLQVNDGIDPWTSCAGLLIGGGAKLPHFRAESKGLESLV